MKPSSCKKSPLFRLLAGWCGLWLYVAALSPIGFAVTACVGALDPDHHIQLQPGENGLRVVLHHEGDCSRHHHGLVAQVLTAFAKPARATDPDHVLQFSSASGLTRCAHISVPTANQAETIAIALARPVSTFAAKPIVLAPPPSPPSDVGGKLIFIRSTVLLI